MTNSKDYVEAREQKISLKPSLEELQTLLEEIIDNGKNIFVENGFIPLDSTITEMINTYQEEYGILSFQFGIEFWLKSYNWSISFPPTEHTNLALFAIKE